MAAVEIVNPSFETGDFTGWTVNPPSGTNALIVSGGTDYGTYRCNFSGSYHGDIDVFQTDGVAIWEGVKITASCVYFQGSASSGNNSGQVFLQWFDSDDNKISENLGNLVKSSGGSNTSSVTATAPANAAFVRIGGRTHHNKDNTVGFDNFLWDLDISPQIVLTFPASGSVYAEGDSIPFRCTIEEGIPVASVEYIATDTGSAAVTSVGTSTTAPYDINYDSLPAGNYSIVAKLVATSGYEATSAPNLMTVGTVVADTREFRASNACSFLVSSNFSNIASAIPSTSRVVGVKTIVDYEVRALIRSLDKGVSDPTVARYQAAFAMVPSMTFETVLLDGASGSYTAVGNTVTNTFDINTSDFLVIEDGTTDEKRWTVLDSDGGHIEIGGEDSFFGLTLMAASDFFNKSIGLRVYPNLGPKPSYADTGDACFRVFLDKLRLQIFFDPGSVEYYFVSPDETQIIKGRLVHFCVDNGDFRNGDAEGSLQFEYALELKDGTQMYVGPDWTIHSEYPPTDANRIADVVPSEVNSEVGMDYNGLPTQQEIVDNKSRYQFITHNFYGDKDWDAMYGVNGVDKAFSYNGEWFYKICTNPDAEKDKPRHVQAHHQHLALGFEEGRVDISVVGQPYNYSGVDGASSWAIGDKVTGLLPLSGTILGVFGSKSIWGISGTTVDNFSTQLLVPNIGAIEYTIVDMGYPVYANAYGIYTLSQTQSYGDYLGTPMSVDVSPWLRPRLIKADNSDKDTVVAWPVRHKNQYRLAFKDGYVLTMTLNAGTNQAPTFSKQKYAIVDEDNLPDTPAEYSTYLIPAAISSQFDNTGKERIHAAPYSSITRTSNPAVTLDVKPSWDSYKFSVSGNTTNINEPVTVTDLSTGDDLGTILITVTDGIGSIDRFVPGEDIPANLSLCRGVLNSGDVVMLQYYPMPYLYIDNPSLESRTDIKTCTSSASADNVWLNSAMANTVTLTLYSTSYNYIDPKDYGAESSGTVEISDASYDSGSNTWSFTAAFNINEDVWGEEYSFNIYTDPETLDGYGYVYIA